MLRHRLAAARKRAKLNQGDLAALMGGKYDQTMISHIERGKTWKSGVLNGVAAARALDVSTDYLLGLTSDPTSVEAGCPSPPRSTSPS